MKAAAAKEDAAWNEVCIKYWGPVLTYIKALAGENWPEDVRDVAQEFFEKEVVEKNVFKEADDMGKSVRSFIIHRAQQTFLDYDRRLKAQCRDVRKQEPLWFEGAEESEYSREQLQALRQEETATKAIDLRLFEELSKDARERLVRYRDLKFRIESSLLFSKRSAQESLDMAHALRTNVPSLQRNVAALKNQVEEYQRERCCSETVAVQHLEASEKAIFEDLMICVLKEVPHGGQKALAAKHGLTEATMKAKVHEWRGRYEKQLREAAQEMGFDWGELKL